MNAVRSRSGKFFWHQTFSPSDLDNDWSLNDGITPNYFTLERGVRQGDSLSWHMY